MSTELAEQSANRFDVVIIGGGAAGLSAALLLARARRSVVVIDAGAPRNAPASGVHGFLTRDGLPPAELVALGQQEVVRYGGVIRHGEAQSVQRTDDGFAVTLGDGSVVAARRVLVTTGLIDELPEVAGVRERWGRDVLHCPYCHGWEFRDQPIGILGSGPRSVHQAQLFRQWTADVVLFTHTMPPLTDEQTEELTARGVRIVSGRVEAVEVAGDRLSGVRLQDGTVVGRRAVAVMPRFVARSRVLASLGLQPSAHPSGLGDHIAADATGLTEVPGVWAAGNVTDIQAKVVEAAAQGELAAAAINADLVAEDTRLAVEAYRQGRAAPAELVSRSAS